MHLFGCTIRYFGVQSDIFDYAIRYVGVPTLSGEHVPLKDAVDISPIKQFKFTSYVYSIQLKTVEHGSNDTLARVEHDRERVG